MKTSLAPLLLLLAGCQRNPAPIAKASGVVSISVDDRDVYWTEPGGRTMRAPKDGGGTPEPVATATPAPAGTIGAGEQVASEPVRGWGLPSVFSTYFVPAPTPPPRGLVPKARAWLEEARQTPPPTPVAAVVSRIVASPVAGGTPHPIAGATGDVTALAANAAGVVWSEAGREPGFVIDPMRPCQTDSCYDQMVWSAGSASGLRALPWGSSTPRLLAPVASPAIALDATWVYFFDPATGGIERVRR